MQFKMHKLDCVTLRDVMRRALNPQNSFMTSFQHKLQTPSDAHTLCSIQNWSKYVV